MLWEVPRVGDENYSAKQVAWSNALEKQEPLIGWDVEVSACSLKIWIISVSTAVLAAHMISNKASCYIILNSSFWTPVSKSIYMKKTRFILACEGPFHWIGHFYLKIREILMSGFVITVSFSSSSMLNGLKKTTCCHKRLHEMQQSWLKCANSTNCTSYF